MNNFTFQKATKRQAKARITIDGPSGAGKTYSALALATELAKKENSKIAVIDTERGSASLYSDRFDFDVLELTPDIHGGFSPANYTAAIKAAESFGYKVIIVDSLTHAWDGEGGALDQVEKASTRNQGNSFVAWKDVTPQHRAMVDAILQSSAHVITTMRSKMDYVLEKDERTGKTTPKKVGLAPIQRAGMEYEFTLVADMDIDHHIWVSKTRCEIMDGKTGSKPDATYWKPFIEWLYSGDAYVEPAKPVAKEPEQASELMSLEMANQEKDSEGIAYCEYQSEELRMKAEQITAQFSKKLSDKMRETLKLKLAAIDSILYHREQQGLTAVS